MDIFKFMDKYFVTIWVVSFIFGSIVTGAAIYALIHFIAKVW